MNAFACIHKDTLLHFFPPTAVFFLFNPPAKKADMQLMQTLLQTMQEKVPKHVSEWPPQTILIALFHAHSLLASKDSKSQRLFSTLRLLEFITCYICHKSFGLHRYDKAIIHFYF